jgi:hypothetical protein
MIEVSPNCEPELCRAETGVIFHTAVLSYLNSCDERLAFAQTLSDLEVVWICNEPPELFPDVRPGLSEPWPPGLFLLSMNRRPMAWSDPHGTSLDWIADLSD